MSADEQPRVTIPIVDISGFLAGDPAAKASCAAQVDDAFSNQGFLQITGHNVSPAIQSAFLGAIAAFFSLPLSEKEKLSQEFSPCHRGYERLGGQKLDELDADATPDQKEGFSIRPERPAGSAFLAGPNQWPDEALVPGFRAAYENYFNAVHSLSKSVFRLVSLALNLPEDYLDAFAADPDGVCLCRAHRYPPSRCKTAQTRGVGAHTDFGALTLLLQDGVGGLEVLHRPTATWHAVDPVAGAYVVNAGDLLQRWTNDRYRSTMHRVLSPRSSESEDRDRYSCAFFNDGALGQVVEALPGCVPEGEAPRYAPVRVVDHLVARYQQSYGAAGTTIEAPPVAAGG